VTTSPPIDFFGVLEADVVVDGRYQIIRRIGVGGMGVVYEAEQVKLQNRVALKILHAKGVQAGAEQSEGDDNKLERFLREARAASAIKHRNVVDIIDFGDLEDGSPYYVMEYLGGRDLSALLETEGVCEWPRVRRLLKQVLSALEAAHDQGIIHRDIKPANIMLLDKPDEWGNDWIKVLDFGIAKVTQSDQESQALTGTSELLGTAPYMAPEIARGAQAGHRADLYAVGIVAYELLTGTVPFKGGNSFQVLLRHINELPQGPSELNPAITPAIESFILRALAKDPEERYVDAAQMVAVLDVIGDEGAIGELSGSDAAAVVEIMERPLPGPPARIISLAEASIREPTVEERFASTPAAPRSRWPMRITLVLVSILVAGLVRGLMGDGSDPVPTLAPTTRIPVAAADKPPSTSTDPSTTHETPSIATSSTGSESIDTHESTSTGEVAPVAHKSPLSRTKCTSIACRQSRTRGRLRKAVRRRCQFSGDSEVVRVKFTISTSGDVLMPRAMPPHEQTQLGRCAVDIVSRGHFPPPDRLSVQLLDFRP